MPQWLCHGFAVGAEVHCLPLEPLTALPLSPWCSCMCSTAKHKLRHWCLQQTSHHMNTWFHCTTLIQAVNLRTNCLVQAGFLTAFSLSICFSLPTLALGCLKYQANETSAVENLAWCFLPSFPLNYRNKCILLLKFYNVSGTPIFSKPTFKPAGYRWAITISHSYSLNSFSWLICQEISLRHWWLKTFLHF